MLSIRTDFFGSEGVVTVVKAIVVVVVDDVVVSGHSLFRLDKELITLFYLYFHKRVPKVQQGVQSVTPQTKT